MIIAQRFLTFRDRGKDSPVAIDIHAPERRSDIEWRCNVSLPA
jgi:hypothetical protein